MEENEFYTAKGYQLKSRLAITESMEDYLEMICRHIADTGFLRVNALAELLNVNPSSASKMTARLKELKLVSFPKYGVITLTDKGREIGEYLLYRHDVLHRFFCKLNSSTCELQQVEQIEHFMTEESIKNLDLLLKNGGFDT